MDRPFLQPGTAERIKNDLRRRAFATRLQLQDPPRVVTLDRQGVEIAPQAVLLEWTNRMPVTGGTDTVTVQSVDGTLSAWQVLDAEVGDAFMLDGRRASITEPVRVINGVATAGFRWTAGR